jgi:SNF2 family DNA or RNA helicase
MSLGSYNGIGEDNAGVSATTPPHSINTNNPPSITLLTTIAEASNHPNEAIRNQVPETLRESRTLVLCPTSLVDNWNDEFNLWTPPSAMEHLGDVFPIHAKLKPKERFNVISNWVEQGGILIVGYSLFRDMIMRTQRSKPDGKVQGLTDDELNKIRDCLLNKANLVVADEAHAMKKNETGITRAAAMIRTHSRIALSGSPLANNLEEYFTLVDWIAPKYLGTRVEFRDRYAEPINSGFYADAHIKDYRKGLKMLEVLKAELDPKVQRKDISAIKDLLPGKTEFLLRMPLTDIQQQAYSLFVRHMEQENNLSRLPPTQLWGWLAILRLLCNHPKCFLEKLRGGDQNSKQNSSKKRSASTAKVLKEADDADIGPEDAPEDDVLLTKPISSLGIPQEVVDQQLALFEDLGTKVDSIKLAHKVQILFGILRYSKIVGDKVLVFSQSIPTLDYLEDQLKANLISHFRLTGSTNMASRQKLTKDFNNNDTSVFLVSTRAGGQGLNLFGANRVVIMDDSFNPMHEEQAIGRVYRLGQKKHVYVYRLTIGGTFEQALQDQSLFKLQLATRVVDRKSQKRHASKDARQYIFQPKVVEQNDLKEYKEKYDKVLNRILCAPET